MAPLYGVVKSGFIEELLFRGLIGGRLSRRFSLLWANVVRALIFLIPHLLVLRIMLRCGPFSLSSSQVRSS
jgi:membrane protease YdiL (CAAX protease family)